MLRLFTPLTAFARGLAIILAVMFAVSLASAWPMGHNPKATSVKPFVPMPKVAKSHLGTRPSYSSSSGSYSSRGSGSYRYRRSYRGGGYSYGK